MSSRESIKVWLACNCHAADSERLLVVVGTYFHFGPAVTDRSIREKSGRESFNLACLRIARAVLPLARSFMTRLGAMDMPTLPVVPDTEPSRAVLDSFRIAIAKRLSDTLPLTLEQAFTGVDYGKKGEDFTVALPRFRLPGKVNEIADKVITDVSRLSAISITIFILCVSHSSSPTNGSNPSSLTNLFSTSA